MKYYVLFYDVLQKKRRKHPVLQSEHENQYGKSWSILQQNWNFVNPYPTNVENRVSS